MYIVARVATNVTREYDLGRGQSSNDTILAVTLRVKAGPLW